MTQAAPGEDRGQLDKSPVSDSPQDTPPWSSALFPQHVEVLTARAITQDIAKARGYLSADTRAQLKRFGFAKSQQGVPALVIPVWSPRGERVEWMVRPDAPRLKDDNLLKYEWPWRHRLRLDVPPSLAAAVRDRSVPLWVTEGILKGDALAAAGAGCVVALSGVYGWKNPDGPLADWDEFGTKGRIVHVVFDSDAQSNPQVNQARRRLVALLANRQAKPDVVVLPDGDTGSKLGVDDFLAGGGTLDDLEQLVHPPDDPDTRTTTDKPNGSNGSGVRVPTRTTPGQLPDLAAEPDILGRFAKTIEAAGLAGETDSAKVLYLSITSRVLPWGPPGNRPVSVMPRGTSGSGKSYTVDQVLRFFPTDAYLNLGSMSRRYLMYTEEELAHKMLIVPELASIADDDELMAALRTLLSEGRLIHGTVDGDGKRRARRIEKKGPTGLIVTTTAAVVDAELETRLLSFITDDTPEQTRRVFKSLAELETSTGDGVDYDQWIDLQRWVAEEATTAVVIPYIGALAELMPNVATRLRRDFVALLSLVRAAAVLHQHHRGRDPRERVVAAIADYTVVRDLISSLVAEAVDAAVSKPIRQTVEAVRSLCEGGVGHTSVKAVSGRLDVGRSAAYDRVRRALSQGWLVNIAAKDERGLKLAPGAPLPEGADGFLPDPDTVLSRWCPDGVPDTGTVETQGFVSGRPGRPGRPVDMGVDSPDSLDSLDSLDVEALASAAAEGDPIAVARFDQMLTVERATFAEVQP